MHNLKSLDCCKYYWYGNSNMDCNNSSRYYKGCDSCRNSNYSSCYNGHSNTSHLIQTNAYGSVLSYGGNDHHKILRSGCRLCFQTSCIHLHVVYVKENNRHHQVFGRFCRRSCSLLRWRQLLPGVEFHFSWQMV